MNLKVNYLNLVRQLVPPHKRQPNRLNFLRSLLYPLQKLFNSFQVWREHSRMMINVNSQTAILLGYLRRKYNEPKIRIETFSSRLLLVGLLREGSGMWPGFSLNEEDLLIHEPEEGDREEYLYLQPVALEYEMEEKYNGADFIVYIPYTVDKDQITSEIEKYKQVLLKYIIIQE